MKNLLEEIGELAKCKSGVIDIPITETTSIQDDLEIFGDDAIEFIQEFSHRFNVDTSEFDYRLYFDAESDLLSRTIINFFKKTKNKPLTVGNLVDAVKSGKLK